MRFRELLLLESNLSCTLRARRNALGRQSIPRSPSYGSSCLSSSPRPRQVQFSILGLRWLLSCQLPILRPSVNYSLFFNLGSPSSNGFPNFFPRPSPFFLLPRILSSPCDATPSSRHFHSCPPRILPSESSSQSLLRSWYSKVISRSSRSV